MPRKSANSRQANDREAFYWACRSVLVRSTLLFGTAGVAFALFLTPMMLRDNRDGARFNVDYSTTGSIETRQWQGPVLSHRAICDFNDSRLPDC